MSRPMPDTVFERAKALFIEGLACHEAGRYPEAEQRYLASLALLPQRVSTLVNLAATRLRLSRPQDALAAAELVLALEPGNRDAIFHRAMAWRQLGRLADALGGFEYLLAADHTLAEPWLRHGQTLHEMGRFDAALASFERALALDPALAQAWVSRGDTLRDLKRHDEAALAYREAIAHGADAELTGYFLASIGGRASPGAAPRAYVQALFDAYAGQFERHVVQVLHYRAHQVLTQPLQGLHPGRFRSALDLGCGTGLCGPLVKPLAERLVGVDLSSQMLARAGSLGVYDQLVHADIAEHLQASPEHHDLVLAADVFIYIGELAPIFAAVNRLMPTGGLFCFSTEVARPGAQGFELLPSLRYAHSETCLRGLAAQHGFEVLSLARQPIREDQRQAVDGVFVHLVRR